VKRQRGSGPRTGLWLVLWTPPEVGYTHTHTGISQRRAPQIMYTYCIYLVGFGCHVTKSVRTFGDIQMCPTTLKYIVGSKNYSRDTSTTDRLLLKLHLLPMLTPVHPKTQGQPQKSCSNSAGHFRRSWIRPVTSTTVRNVPALDR
jgi:hypothetical protein